MPMDGDRYPPSLEYSRAKSPMHAYSGNRPWRLFLPPRGIRCEEFAAPLSEPVRPSWKNILMISHGKAAVRQHSVRLCGHPADALSLREGGTGVLDDAAEGHDLELTNQRDR